MRRLATAERIRRFLSALGRATNRPATVYLTGGATAVLYGWRDSTVDVDVKFVPERDELFRAIRDLKDELEINVELASPDLFIPVTDDWPAASRLETTEGGLTVRHFDLRAQALAKIERAHTRDIADVHAMLARDLVTRQQLRQYLADIKPNLYRFPTIDPRALSERLGRVLEE